MKKITLTPEHILLLKNMNVRWNAGAYEGAPAIDLKRPYGNSNVWESIAELLEITPIEDDEEEKHWPKGTRERCLRLHYEMETALQVCLAAQSFEPGEYVASNYDYDWKRA